MGASCEVTHELVTQLLPVVGIQQRHNIFKLCNCDICDMQGDMSRARLFHFIFFLSTLFCFCVLKGDGLTSGDGEYRVGKVFIHCFLR